MKYFILLFQVKAILLLFCQVFLNFINSSTFFLLFFTSPHRSVDLPEIDLFVVNIAHFLLHLIYMSLRGVRFCFIATSSVLPISSLVDSQQSHHWTSEAGHLKSHTILKGKTSTRYVVSMILYKVQQIYERAWICFSKYFSGFDL